MRRWSVFGHYFQTCDFSPGRNRFVNQINGQFRHNLNVIAFYPLSQHSSAQVVNRWKKLKACQTREPIYLPAGTSKYGQISAMRGPVDNCEFHTMWSALNLPAREFSVNGYLKVIYHPLYDMNNYVLIWGDWLLCDPLRGSHDSQAPHIRKHLCPILWQLWFICHKFIHTI